MTKCIACATQQETMRGVYIAVLLSLQRSPCLAVISILLVGPPPWVRRALWAAWAHRLSNSLVVPVFTDFFLFLSNRAGAYHHSGADIRLQTGRV